MADGGAGGHAKAEALSVCEKSLLTTTLVTPADAGVQFVYLIV